MTETARESKANTFISVCICRQILYHHLLGLSNLSAFVQDVCVPVCVCDSVCVFPCDSEIICDINV